MPVFAIQTKNYLHAMTLAALAEFLDFDSDKQFIDKDVCEALSLILNEIELCVAMDAARRKPTDLRIGETAENGEWQEFVTYLERTAEAFRKHFADEEARFAAARAKYGTVELE